MKNEKIVTSKIAHSLRLESFRTSAPLILAALVLMFATSSLATAQTYTDLYNFCCKNGRNPNGILAQGQDGNLYGTTSRGGAKNHGVIFRITPDGSFGLLYATHGAIGGLTLGTDGNFYGNDGYGGIQFTGSVFKIARSGELTRLCSGCTGHGGSMLTQGADGRFYGTTADHAYKITASGIYHLLGALPRESYASLLQGTDGRFYGTTEWGGTKNDGTVFKVTPKGTVKIVHNFDGAHGSTPQSPLIQGSDGDFYGTASAGGSYGQGVVFKLTLPNTITVLHTFAGNDGAAPSGLIQATDGNFYGSAYGGPSGYGVIFQITPAGAYSILYYFDGTQSTYPNSLMQHTNGKIYGLSPRGGKYNDGVFFSFDVGLKPFVSLVSNFGKVGKTIEILGQGFTGTTAVSFNGTTATFTVVSDTYLTTTVPTGATTGFVTVTTPSGLLTSNKLFMVKP